MDGLHLFDAGDGATRYDGVRGIVTEASALWATVAWEDGRSEEVEQGDPTVWAFQLDDPAEEARVRGELAALLARENRDDLFALTRAEVRKIEDLQEELEEGDWRSSDADDIEEAHETWARSGPLAPPPPVDLTPCRPVPPQEVRRAA